MHQRRARITGKSGPAVAGTRSAHERKTDGSIDRQPTDLSESLLEFEFGLAFANQSFQRWITRCMNVAGLKDVTPMDVLVLTHVSHRDRGKRLADICFVLNTDDTHVVSYSMRKLIALRLVKTTKRGKEVIYAITPLGQEYLARYREVRERLLLSSLATYGPESAAVAALVQFLRTVSGLHDQAARAASIL